VPGTDGEGVLRKSIQVLLILLSPLVVSAAGEHTDQVAPTLLALILILASAKLGSELFERAGQPAVLGELLAGVVLGNLVLLSPGLDFFEPLRATAPAENWAIVIDSLARIGVIILLFEVGLESTVQGMLKVGGSAFLVAVLGVIAPFVLGFGVSRLLITELPSTLAGLVPPDFSLNYVHLFIGAVLCATSVGITARVLKDLGKLKRKESQIILGAAVIDDVLGLLILAVVSGLVSAAEQGTPLNIAAILQLVAVALLFLGGSLAAGVLLVPRVMRQLSRLRTSGIMLISALLLAFGLSYLANAAGLAAIVGAFAAGLILEEVHFRSFREDIAIEHLLRPISTLLVPIFFVMMGIQVRLETFSDLSVLGMAAGLTVAAVIGKQICGLGVLGKGMDRVTVGVGMIPRGEVGLIFASIGRSLRIIDDGIFSAIVIMVMVTTLVTPPVLKLTIARWDRKKPQRD
jgi:Kef-type K+ transport system membrane component KefB